jgi:hypothetical protein
MTGAIAVAVEVVMAVEGNTGMEAGVGMDIVDMYAVTNDYLKNWRLFQRNSRQFFR